MIFSRVLPPFGFATYARQTLSIAVDSCRATAKSRAGLVLVVFIPISVAAVLPQYMENFGVPLFPRTEYILAFLTAPLTNPFTPWVIVPLLIILLAGELVWRERDAGLAEITDSAPVPESAVLLGKLLGLSFLLGALMAHLIAAGVLVQAFMGHFDFDLGLYVRVLFGLQLPEYLLFAVTAVAMHGMVNQKHIAHLVILGAYAFIAFASNFGVEHDLFIYGASPAWSYTAMSGFGRSVEPWLWFKLYWTGWAILLGVAARLLWVRGVGKGARIRSAGRRFTRPTAGAAATAVGLVLGCGGYILYQTDRLNPQIIGVSEERQWRADYERHYSQYADIPLPDLASAALNVDIEPEEGALKVRGSYHLVNRGAEAIDSIHLSTHPESTTAFTLEPAGTPVLSGADLGYSIHALAKPLQPGESLRLIFELSVDSPGFRTDEIGASVVPNGTFVRLAPLLPALGYQPGRELRKAADRRTQGLPPRAEFAPLSDSVGHDELIARNPARFDVVIRTAADQIAVAPGQLLETWTEKGRRCFRYAAETPVDAVFSAKYSVLEAQWNDIPIRIFHHPSHTANLELMIRSVRASLDHYAEQFGPYPHRHISLVERPGIGGMHADPGLISFQAGYSMFNLDGGANLPNFPFAVVAHEVAHQWWGSHLYDGRRVEGNPLLSESLAEYSAFQVLRKTCGQEDLRRYLRGLRAHYGVGGKRAAVPLLRATNKYHQYFKGPIALHAISELIGQEPVNLALRRLLEAHASGAILTTLDLYRQLRTVTPGSLQYLLHDLFQANTSWEFETEEAAARQVNAAEWQVTLTVRARKVVVDETGRETEIPMDEPIQVGVFGPSEAGGSSTQPLYLQMHSIRSGEQKITVTVPRKPVQAGIDPYHLLDWVEDGDNSNIEPIQIEESAAR
jgi:ABC-2 type transport system permease protein